MRKVLSILLLFLICLPTFGHSQEVMVVKARGIGDIIDGQEGMARDIAVQDALRNAVEQALGTYIKSETVVQNYQLISDQIFSKTEGYIQKYYIQDETATRTLYKIKIEAYVASHKLQNDLAAIGLLMLQKHKPRVMVVIPEQHLTRRKVPDPAGETEIIKKLLEKGFKVVDQSQVKKIRYNDQVRAALAGDDKTAAKIGLQYGAEVIIVGEAFSEFATSGGVLGNMISCRARVEARAIRTDTGEIVAADGKHAAGIDISENIAGKKALQNAGGQLGDYLITQILSTWRSEVVDATTVQLIIIGVDYQQFAKFKMLLKDSVRGVKAIHQRSFSEKRGVLDIDFKGDPQALADELALKDFGNFKVAITNFTSNRLDLEVLKK
ncbi:MAG: hypothetical protein KKI12_06235 [Proteobacteria bacterium]|nr:hypothetical protein [Pseudomonadota bacterium]MBU4259833.1 hypothetical protein [Pseudomonadota bacterium]MBU4287755.1 hypothetical protein [Pseudomonadota bacterium]MBU4414333.1 hypothetical protein [Pseudomonadota bacterium]MCG2756833.1 hypothetical protein [Desulfobacteraceae bacterium]